MDWYGALDKDIIEDIKKYQDDLDKLLTIVNQLAKDEYDLGYKDGYDAGEHIGWSDCYDLMREDD